MTNSYTSQLDSTPVPVTFLQSVATDFVFLIFYSLFPFPISSNSPTQVPTPKHIDLHIA